MFYYAGAVQVQTKVSLIRGLFFYYQGLHRNITTQYSSAPHTFDRYAGNVIGAG